MASPLEAANTTVILGLLNVITAFAGADIAPPNLIERIIWPQRNASVSATSFLKTTFLLSAGGPLHKITLSALDSLHRHSLFKGVGKGHMLGTPFFPDTGLSYIRHPTAGQTPEQELVRNGLLVRTLNGMQESTETVEQPAFDEQSTRQNISVTYLELMDAGNISSSGAITLDDERVRLKTVLLVACTEMPSMVLTFVAAMIWSPIAASVFLTPLMLKVLATFTALAREDFTAYPKKLPHPWPGSTSNSKFEIHVPGDGFQVISGPDELILPFFRHYGHPIRCRWRETVQMVIMVTLGLYHPLLLVSSMTWMPLRVQLAWLVYQIYICCTMLIVRYCGGELWGTTEERFGEALASAAVDKHGSVLIENQDGSMMVARIHRTFHDSYTEGKARVAALVSR